MNNALNQIFKCLVIDLIRVFESRIKYSIDLFNKILDKVNSFYLVWAKNSIVKRRLNSCNSLLFASKNRELFSISINILNNFFESLELRLNFVFLSKFNLLL